MRSTSAPTKRSWMPSVTMRREEAVQRWPVEKKAPLAAHSTAVFRSESSSTTSGFLPPISSWKRRRRSAEAMATRLPVATEPVKEMASTSALSRIAWPTTEPDPMTRFSTPFGRPARFRMSASAQPQPGTRSAGLKTTVLP